MNVYVILMLCKYHLLAALLFFIVNTVLYTFYIYTSLSFYFIQEFIACPLHSRTPNAVHKGSLHALHVELLRGCSYYNLGIQVLVLH